MRTLPSITIIVTRKPPHFCRGRISESQQVDVLCWPSGFVRPEEQERRAFEDEAVCKLGLREAIQEPFAAEPGERELMFDAGVMAPLEKPCLDGCGDVLRLARHRTIVSR